MPLSRTITEGDLDSRSAEFVRELSFDAPSHDADFEADGREEASESTGFCPFNEQRF